MLSRSTWACELKFDFAEISKINVTSRSTWACELKLFLNPFFFHPFRHAPRERVSWNPILVYSAVKLPVTLHVSVWVEIYCIFLVHFQAIVTLHVSVWVEIKNSATQAEPIVSRSTWACELKLSFLDTLGSRYGHAPRERVSWNVNAQGFYLHASQSRSTWACELKFCWFWRLFWILWSRSTWACELKSICSKLTLEPFSHAPRERVSWNSVKKGVNIMKRVTLHVSVWVEIPLLLRLRLGTRVTLHVSVWVEMKI